MNGIDAGILRKFEALRERLVKLDSLAVAFSGGADSSFLLKTAHDVLGARCLAVTARSEIFPSAEQADAEEFARSLGVRHLTMEGPGLDCPAFAANPPDRCYHCKTDLFRRLWKLAEAERFKHVADGSNADDLADFRPGAKAIRELNVLSPLLEAQLGKKEIRLLSRAMNLRTWDKPSLACLATRIPYGAAITPTKLKQADQAEEFLRSLGIRECRVRHHGAIARIEAPQADFARLVSELREQVIARFREIGFVYVALDLAGYRTGSMNEVLRPRQGPAGSKKTLEEDALPRRLPGGSG